MKPLDIPGIVNGYDVDGIIWRGGQPTNETLQLLAKRGCKAVVDLNNEGMEADFQATNVIQLGMRYFPKCWSGIIPPTQAKLIFALDTLDYLVKKQLFPIFIHCQHGSDRTGTLCAAWRIHNDGWTFDQAMEEAFLSLGLQGMHEFWMAAAVAEYWKDEQEKPFP